jgi:hypothetical protein
VKHTAEIKVAKQVTLTVDGEEFEALLHAVRYACSGLGMYGYERRTVVENLYRDLRQVEHSLRREFNVYTDSKLYRL